MVRGLASSLLDPCSPYQEHLWQVGVCFIWPIGYPGGGARLRERGHCGEAQDALRVVLAPHLVQRYVEKVHILHGSFWFEAICRGAF